MNDTTEVLSCIDHRAGNTEALVDECRRITHYLLGKEPPDSVSKASLLTSQAGIVGTSFQVTVGAAMSDFLKPLEQIKHLSVLLGLFCSLLVVFFINRLVWMPLLKKSQLYAEQ